MKLFHLQQSFKASWILRGRTIPTVTPSRYWVKALSIHLIGKVSCLLSYLLLIHKKNYSYLTDSQYYTWLSKKYFRLHLSQSEHQQAICETSIFFFWLIFLVNSSSSLTTLRFPHSLSIDRNLGEFSKFSMPSISTRFSSSTAITTFSEGLSSSMKPWFFWK